MSNTNTTERPTEEGTKSRGGLNLRIVFHTVRRHTLAFFGVIFLAASAMAGVWYFLPLPKKSAAVVFHISAQPQVLLTVTLESRVDFTAYKQAQFALIKNRRTFNAAIKDPQIRNLGIIQTAQPDALTWLDRSLQVEARQGEFMRVTIDGDNGEELVTVLSAVAKAYQAAAYEQDNGARIHRQDELEKTYAKGKAELRQFQAKIDEIAVALGSKDGATLAILDAFRQDSLRVAVHEHAARRDELDLASSYLFSVKSISKRSAIMAVAGAMWLATLPQGGQLNAQVVPQGVIEEELRRDPVVRELEVAVGRASQALKDTEALFQPGSTAPAITRARENLKTAEEKREKYCIDAKTRVETLLKEKFAQNEEARASSIQAEYDRNKARVDQAWAKVNEIQKDIGKSNIFKIELENLKSDIAQKEKVTSLISDEIERLKVEGKVPARVTVAEEPFVVAGIEGNRRLKYALLTSLGVFLVGFGGIIGWELRTRRVTAVEDISPGLGARLIGTIPPFTATAREASNTDAYAILVEAIDTTRTMLMHGGGPDGTRQRVLLVTSGLAGEGKTTLSGHLAISLARAGFRTLLVDGDMHAPTAHSLFELPISPGLSELLCGEADLARTVRATPVPGLSIVPAGKWTMTTRQRLVGDRWGRIKREMESQFDFVVVDTAPLLLVTDTMLLAREVDGVIVSVLMGVSQIARVEETLNKLYAVGAEVVGVVVNKVPSTAYYQKYAYRRYPAAPAQITPQGPGYSTVVSENKGLAVVSGLDGAQADESLRYAEECSEEE